jgi:hypothetical protein
MNKVIKSLVMGIAILGLVANVSFANGSGSIAAGVLDVEAFSAGYGLSADGKILPIMSGAAGGIGGAVGVSGAEADGFVFDGTVGGNVSTIGGGFSETDAYRFTPQQGDVGIGVGSWTTTSAVTGASVDVNVDPDQGFGEADGSIVGFTAMGSLNGSIVGSSPRGDWETDGFSAGVAGQGAVGGFAGGVFAASGPDIEIPGGNPFKSSNWGYTPGPTVDSNAGAFAEAQISMNGFSNSESYRFIDNNNGFHTEGMGTFVEAETNVTSYGASGSYDNGFSGAGACLVGGYVAVGGAGTHTMQTNDNGIANATAVGVYAGAGVLNTTFHGNATGYSGTSMTTHPTANGVVSSSAAGMQVTARSGQNQPQ